MLANLKYAFRALTRTPFVTAIAVLSLALGIGANAAIFSIFNQMLLRPLPVEEPDRLVNLAAPGPKPGSQSCNQAGDCDEVFSYLMYRDLESDPGSFSAIAAHRLFGANLARSGETTTSGEGLYVSGSYFQVLGLQAAGGRLLQPSDDQTIGEHYVTVLSHGYWQNNLGGDRNVIGGTVVVNGQSMTVVGVAPAGFDGTTLGGRPDVYVPLSMRGVLSQGFEQFDNRRSYWAYVFARLAPGATMDQAGAQLNSRYQAIINDVEAPLQESMSDQTMQRFREKDLLFSDGRMGQSSVHGEARTPLILLMSVTGVVLLIACANIANLLLARGANRSQEMAIRGSLGASRGQMLNQLLVESVMLAVLGGLASLVVARGTLALMGSMLPPEVSSIIMLELHPSVLLFTAVLSLGTGLIFGLYPALHSTRTELATTLRASSGQPSGARSAARFRSTLVTAQLALSTALLVSAGLFIKSLLNVSRVDLGLQPENVVTFAISPELNGYAEADMRSLFDRVVEEWAAVPGVTGVTAGMVPILSGSNWGSSVEVQGYECGPDIDCGSRFNAVGPGYFDVLGIRLIAGREFTAADGEDAPKVTVVNEAFTRKFNLEGRDAVGTMMSDGGDELDMQIVGVVQDAKYSEVKDDVPPLFYLPHKQQGGLGSLTFYARTGVDPTAVVRGVPDLVKSLDANLPVEELKTLEQQVNENVFLDRFISTLSAAFALLATLLAAVGLYGVLSYTVSQRTREIGVRMALGAHGRDVRGMVLGQVARMTVVGAVIGMIAAFFIGRGAQSLLFGLEGFDVVVVLSTGLLLAAVALSAGFIPALKASQVHPMEALRYE